eukprot:TRINITY_DN1945_c0_g1_i2.p1 TRINITY_DN1945_c0_g1~~TRINITY_DN1945_c0_g1_i2.p1  ORF type:complete len:169 (-),score=22.49 TRINITY_DN1945_c0_g1_i2:148-603(-)
MAFLCGFFGLAIFPCLFYYDEALRRNTGDEVLELRAARTDAKLVRSHDASLGFKDQQPHCNVTVGDTTCEYPGRSLSPGCCKAYQEEVCYGFKERDVTFWTQPPCDKLNLYRKPSLKPCMNFGDHWYIHNNEQGYKCLKAAISKTIQDKPK